MHTELTSQFNVIDDALNALSRKSRDETGTDPVPEIE
ncbi:hypothetical protein GZL_07300 [Streptomyces sp. 769]|nr:hypothetical protein GZL_07300 [Streptomyces sp. 769]